MNRYGTIKMPSAQGLPRLSMPRASAPNNRRGGTVRTKTGISWKAPANARFISLLTGKGSDGQPESGAHDYRDGYNEYTQRVDLDGQGGSTTGPVLLAGTYVGSPVPSNYSESGGTPGGASWVIYHTFEYTSVDVGDYQPAQAGTAATAFGKALPGGPTGLPASITTFTGIKIVPGQTYSISVPAGGEVMFTYA